VSEEEKEGKNEDEEEVMGTLRSGGYERKKGCGVILKKEAA
jgi:hypothetical protein